MSLRTNLALSHIDKSRKQFVKPAEGKVIGNYSIEKVIGEGTFGKVYKGIHLNTGEKVAIKILEKNKIVEEDSIERVRREIMFLKGLKGDNIIQLYEKIESSDSIFLVMEYAEGGELFNYIVKRKRLNEKEAAFFFCQIVDSLEILHRSNICHRYIHFELKRDLKPENLLLDENKIVKIIDFGLSNCYEDNQLLKTPCGSPCYAAPEMLQGKRYSGLSVDIWSTGIILYAMVNGFLPFEDDNNSILYKKIQECHLLFPFFIQEDCLDMINRILVVNPMKRITIEEIKTHKFYLTGRELLKKREKNIDKYVISSAVFERMSKLGYEKEDVLDNLTENNHNNITATFFLLFNKYKKEMYYKGDSKGIINKIAPLNLNIKDYFTPIQEEVSTERREKSELDFKLNKDKKEEETKHNTTNDSRLESNLSTNNVRNHSKWYSIDHCNKELNPKENSFAAKNNKDEYIINTKKDIRNFGLNDALKARFNNLKRENNNTVRLKKLELFNNYHTIEAERHISSLEQSKDIKANLTNHFLMNTPKIGKSSGMKEKNEMKMYLEKKFKYVLDSKKRDNLNNQNRNAVNISTFQSDSIKKDGGNFKSFKINQNLQNLIKKGCKLKFRNYQQNLQKNNEKYLLCNTNLSSQEHFKLFDGAFSVTPANKGVKNLSVSIDNKSFLNSFKKDKIHHHVTNSSNLTKHFNSFENSHSKEKGDSLTSKVLLTETLQNRVHANRERVKTLNSFFSKNDHETIYIKPLMTETGTLNSKSFKLSDVKKVPYKFFQSTNKGKSYTKQDNYIFQIDNVMIMREKIYRFCKLNNIKIVETDKSKFECQSRNQGFAVEILKSGNLNQLKITHLCGSENFTNEVIKAFKSEFDKEKKV